MKRLLGLVIIIFLFNGCDDGDMQFMSFNFGTAPVKECITSDRLIYKIKEKEALIISIPKAIFDNVEGTKTVTIGKINNGQIEVLYRLFSDSVTEGNLCFDISPANPIVTDEWKAKGGTIEITIKAIPAKPDPITRNTEIKEYSNIIIFKNIVFEKGTEQLVFSTYTFGNYKTKINKPALKF